MFGKDVLVILWVLGLDTEGVDGGKHFAFFLGLKHFMATITAFSYITENISIWQGFYDMVNIWKHWKYFLNNNLHQNIVLKYMHRRGMISP